MNSYIYIYRYIDIRPDFEGRGNRGMGTVTLLRCYAGWGRVALVTLDVIDIQ